MAVASFLFHAEGDESHRAFARRHSCKDRTIAGYIMKGDVDIFHELNALYRVGRRMSL